MRDKTEFTGPRAVQGKAGAASAISSADGLVDRWGGAHRPRPTPNSHLCTCGRLREACVHDRVRALWRDSLSLSRRSPAQI